MASLKKSFYAIGLMQLAFNLNIWQGMTFLAAEFLSNQA